VDEQLSLQFYMATSHRETGQGVLNRDDWALELVQRMRLSARNDFTYGLNYRSSDNAAVTVPGLVFVPPSRTLIYSSAFIDDAMKFLGDRLTVSGGIKVEDNDFTGLEWLPNIRTLWQLQPNQSLWAAVSRGARMPSIADNDSTTDLPGTTRFLSLPNTALPAEMLTAYELGWRLHAYDRWSVDVALFSNHYDDLRSRESMFIPTPPTRVQMRDAKMFGRTYGAEMVMVAQLSSAWRLQANASYLQMNLAIDPSSTDITSIADASSSPQWQVGLRSSLRLGSHCEVYAQYRYVDALPTLQVASYQSLDVNATWSLPQGLELMIVGQNLLNASHAEFRNAPNFPLSSEIQRGAYLQLRWTR
jgi:iron complex outermembrane recepter protein